MKHRNCVTDPLTRQWWREYGQMCRDGNPLGISFTEYVAHRVLSLGRHDVTDAPASPSYTASCGHSHPWGVPCGDAYLT